MKGLMVNRPSTDDPGAFDASGGFQGRDSVLTEWVGQGSANDALVRATHQVAGTDANVLLLGERGVGKGLLARIIHGQSVRAARPFITINCAALDPVALTAELFGSEMLGHQGWATARVGQLERVGDGIVYLQEISALSRALQDRLGRALAEKSFERLGAVERVPLRARVLASARLDLRQEVAEGRFDDRLLYEFGATLQVPALRQRSAEIPRLAGHFLDHYARAHDRSVAAFSQDALDLLQSCEWPGNVRQLRHVVERAVIASSREVIEPGDLADEITDTRDELGLGSEEGVSLDAMERRHIRRVLQMTDGRITEAADLLGIHRNTLRRKLEQYGLIAN